MSPRPRWCRGHRSRSHTADVIVEAWGPSRLACLEETALGLVDTFADAHGAAATDRHRVELGPAGDTELVVALLDEVIYVVDVRDVVPVTVALEDDEAGGLTGWLGTVPITGVEVTGAGPKGISRSGLTIGRRRGRWRCRVEIDV